MQLIELYAKQNSPIPPKHRNSIIHICADHINLITEFEPSTAQKILWAQCLVELFPQLKNSSETEPDYVILIYIV